MAERKDAITIWAESQGKKPSEILGELEGLNKRFNELYVDGPFLTFGDDLDAHKAMAKEFKARPELLRAFDAYRRVIKNEAPVQDSLESARNTGFIGDILRGVGDLFGGNFSEKSDEEILGEYGFTDMGDGKFTAPWLEKTAFEDTAERVKDLGMSDEEIEAQEIEDVKEKNRILQEEQKATQAKNVFNVDQDPQIAAVRQQVDRSKANPFMFGTEGNRSQIDSLLDASSDKIPMPNRSDARSVADFNNAFANRQFVKNAAFRKQRELDDLAEDRQAIVNNHLDAMSAWEAKNKGKHEMADKGVENWTDQDKIAFVRNFNLGNFDDPAPAPAPKGVPMFDKDGLMGFVPEKQHEADMGGQKFKVNMDQPNMLQRQERKNNAMLEDIRSKGNPFEKFGGSTDYAAEVASRKPVSMSNPAPQRDDRYKNPAYSQQNPLVNRDDRYKNPAYSQQTPISRVDQVRKDVNAEVNDILDRVPISVPPTSKPSQRKQVSPISRASGDSDARKTNITLDDFDLPTKIVNKLNLKPTYPFFGD